jgi:quercetin dioxygenase-like cupin family protein
MKRLLLLLALTPFLHAQEVEITAEPHHHLVLENKSVRVFNIEVAPNDATQMHWHRHDYIAVAIGPSEISNTVKDKPAVTVKFVDGDTRFAQATFAHAVRATSPQPFRNVTVELLDDAALRTATSTWDDSRSLDILHGGTLQILFVKDNVRVSETELQPGAQIPEHHHTGPHLVIALTDLDLRSDVKGQPPATVHFKSGESKWIEAGATHTVTNAGPAPAKYVTLEFP